MTEQSVTLEQLKEQNQVLLELLARDQLKSRFKRAPRTREPKVKKAKPRAKGMHPVVEFLLDEMEHAGSSAFDLSLKAGISCNGVSNWRGGMSPRLDTLEAALNVLGYTLAAVPLKPKE